MGKPVLGEFAKMEVIIEESYEFKVGNVPVRTSQNQLKPVESSLKQPAISLRKVWNQSEPVSFSFKPS